MTPDRLTACPIPHVHRTLLQVERCWGCGVAGTLPAPSEWTGGYAALCGTCQRPLMTDEAPAGLCERCSLANTARQLLEAHDAH